MKTSLFRHLSLTALALAWAAPATIAAEPDAPAAFGPVPTERQLRWHKMEFYGVLHFTVTTDKVRLRITRAPVCPAIAEVGLFAEP